MYKILKPITMIALLAALCGCSKAPADLAERLGAAAAEGKFFYAHQDDLCYGHAWHVTDAQNDDITRSDVKEVSGRYPFIAGFDLGGIERGDSANLDGVDFGFMRRAAIKHCERGGIVTFSWHARNPLTGGDAWDVSDTTVVASILDGGTRHDEFMLWLGRVAAFLDSLRDKDGNLIPIIFRPWHENVGSWFWWGGKLCSAEEYRALWKLTHDYLAGERGLGGMLWAYSPNPDHSRAECINRYPGDAYVDIIGFDVYGNGPMPAAREDFIAKVQDGLAFVSSFAIGHSKLYCISEAGYEGIPDPQWWTGTLLPSLEGYNPCYVLTWRNAWDRPGHFYAPWKGSADAADFVEFANDDRTILLK